MKKHFARPISIAPHESEDLNAISSEPSRFELLQALTGLGAYASLGFVVQRGIFRKEVEELQNLWRPYNPRKQIPRFGMSLTSLDGGDSGVPDLDSLFEYNQLFGTSHKEADFKEPTKALDSLSSLHPLFDRFLPDLGRSHLLRFDKGGYFPPHRDSYGLRIETFRILVLLDNCKREQFVFLMNGERVPLEPWQAYYVNTQIEHSVFSFANGATCLVMNLPITKDNVVKLMHSLSAR